MVFNKELRDIVNTFRADFVPMHDIWIYSIALAVKAKVVFDPQPHILYRQHGDNTIGQGQGQMHEWHRRLKRLNSHERYRQACELLRGYAPFMGSDELDTLSTFVNARQSLAAVCDSSATSVSYVPTAAPTASSSSPFCSIFTKSRQWRNQ